MILYDVNKVGTYRLKVFKQIIIKLPIFTYKNYKI